MIEKVKEYLKQWSMIPRGARVLIGVSGGADSVCLCMILKELSAEMEFSVEVIHVEHGIRGEDSRRDADFVQNLCEKYEIPCSVESVDVPSYAQKERLSLEEAARILRYHVFAERASVHPESRIALAHHMEDNAETMILQMIRGSGLDGLCGMRPMRTGEKKETYIRPLLSCSREEIEEYLRKCGQDYCSDATNEDVAYSRNRIRHKVIPELNAVNDRAVCHMNQAARDLGELRDYLDTVVDEAMEYTVKEDGGRILLEVGALKKLPQIIRMRVVHRAAAMAAGAKKDIARVHLEAIASLIDKQTGRCVDLPYGLRAQHSYREIILSCGKMPEQSQDFFEVTKEQLEILRVGNGQKTLSFDLQGGRFTLQVFCFSGKMQEIPRKKYTKWLDYDKIKNGLLIRTRKPQDFFVLDLKGHRKKLSDYFITEKIPADKRDHYPLVTQGAQVLWVAGGRMGASALVEETTQYVLEIAVKPVAQEHAVWYQFCEEGGTNDGL